MAFHPAAAFMSEVEDDHQSVTSVAMSIWGGLDEPIVNELRESQKAANVLRRRLMAEYTRVKAMDAEEFADKFPECNELRFNYGQVIVRHVNLARQKAAMPNANLEFLLSKVVNSVTILRAAWEKTTYFGKAVAYPRIDVPTPADVVQPVVDHVAGERHPRTELSLSTTVMETGGAADVPCASSPLDPGEIDVEGAAEMNDSIFLRPVMPARR